LARFQRKTKAVRRRRWGVSLVCGATLAASLFVIPGCQAATCKVQSENLAERLWKSVFRPEDPLPHVVTPAPAPAPALTARTQDKPVPPAKAIRAPENFKLSGSPAAPVTCEIFTDYECPACARFYAEVVPQLRADYVETGKIRLLHRDFPLIIHQHSRLAARYANGAGLAGYYDLAVAQIFRTQSSWGLTGDIDAQLAQVLPPEVMDRVRRSVRSDVHLDDGVLHDVEQGQADQLRQTPSVAIVTKQGRQILGAPDYVALKNALDAVLQ
jgi:protein-disulfide isomerase